MGGGVIYYSYIYLLINQPAVGAVTGCEYHGSAVTALVTPDRYIYADTRVGVLLKQLIITNLNPLQ